jgi:hypothetical protein
MAPEAPALARKVDLMRLRMGESVSMVTSLMLSGAAAYLFWAMPGWSPQGELAKYALAWIVVAYLGLQLFALLDNAMHVRITGVVDTISAVMPFVVGLLALLNMAQGSLRLSGYQENALALLLAVSALDFVITLWMRFALNRRSLGIDAGS